MKTMRMLVATLGLCTFGVVGCSSSSSSDRETLPKAATYEPENFEEDTTTTTETTVETDVDTTTEDRTPVRGTDEPSMTNDEIMEPSTDDSVESLGSDTGADSESGTDTSSDSKKKKDTGTDVGSGGTAPDSSGY